MPRAPETRVRYTSAVGMIRFERSLTVSKNGEWVEACCGESLVETCYQLHMSPSLGMARDFPEKVVTAGIVVGGIGDSTMWTYSAHVYRRLG